MNQARRFQNDVFRPSTKGMRIKLSQIILTSVLRNLMWIFLNKE